MKKTVKIIAFIALFVVLSYGLNLSIKFLNTSKQKKIREHKKMYCYETFYKGAVNPALYVKDTILCDSLKQYYQKMENGNSNPVFNFLPYLVPVDTFVYVLSYSRDSSIAKIAFFHEHAGHHFSDEGYVYTHTLHDHRKYNHFH